VGLDVRIGLERLMDDAPFVGVHRLELHDVPEPADLVGEFHGALGQLLTGLTAVAADVEQRPSPERWIGAVVAVELGREREGTVDGQEIAQPSRGRQLGQSAVPGVPAAPPTSSPSM
jgi:hypothetical protein